MTDHIFDCILVDAVLLSYRYKMFTTIVKHIDERLYYADRMKMVEQVAKETDEELSCYILEAITEGISYDHLKARTGIPCCKDVYYDLYRRFFWLLSKERQ